MKLKLLKKICIVSSIIFAMTPINAFASYLDYIDVEQVNGSISLYGMTVPELIYSEARAHDINPKIILVLLERESNAITQAIPHYHDDQLNDVKSLTREGWPLFYMYDERMAKCLNGDDSKCSDLNWPNSQGSPTYLQRTIDFAGIGQQIAYATWNFDSKFKAATNKSASICPTDKEPACVYPDDYINITADNTATKILYSYTPHEVSYNLDSSFYNNYLAWFSEAPTPTYSRTNIISDENFRYFSASHKNEMTIEQIRQKMIDKGNGWLVNGYYTSNLIPRYIRVAYPMAGSAPVTPDPGPKAPDKPGDCARDGVVDSTDLSILADSWGKQVSIYTQGDLSGDGLVDSTDLSILADGWGK